MLTDLTEPAPAKVNLFLHVTGRRADGYHLLDSLVVFAGIGDAVTARDADDLRLSVTGPFAAGLAAEPNNLVLRAAHALAAEAGIAPRAHLTLEKRLPVASGIGGGSADAAAALRLLCRLWNLRPDYDALLRLAARLGADVPVCLGSRSRRMSGIGEILGPVPPLPNCGLLLANPGVAVSTADVFRRRTAAFSPPANLPDQWADAAALTGTLRAAGNDLQPPAVALCPEIETVLRAIDSQPGCLLARMSGSGATCFGLFPHPAAAAQAAAALGGVGWWTWGGALHEV